MTQLVSKFLERYPAYDNVLILCFFALTGKLFNGEARSLRRELPELLPWTFPHGATEEGF